MTVQHFGGLHAAWLLNVCVCVACVCTHVCVWGSFLKKAHLRGRSAGVCGTLNDVYDVSKCVVCILMFAFFYFCATGPNCVTWTVLGTTTLLHIWLRVHVGWPATLRVKAKYPRANPLRLSERERERERERDAETEGGKEKKRAEVSISLSIRLSACHFGQLCRHPVRSDSLSFELLWTGSPPTATAAQETWMKQTRVKMRGWWGTLYFSCWEV